MESKYKQNKNKHSPSLKIIPENKLKLFYKNKLNSLDFIN